MPGPWVPPWLPRCHGMAPVPGYSRQAVTRPYSGPAGAVVVVSSDRLICSQAWTGLDTGTTLQALPRANARLERTPRVRPGAVTAVTHPAPATVAPATSAGQRTTRSPAAPAGRPARPIAPLVPSGRRASTSPSSSSLSAWGEQRPEGSRRPGGPGWTSLPQVSTPFRQGCALWGWALVARLVALRETTPNHPSRRLVADRRRSIPLPELAEAHRSRRPLARRADHRPHPALTVPPAPASFLQGTTDRYKGEVGMPLPQHHPPDLRICHFRQATPALPLARCLARPLARPPARSLAGPACGRVRRVRPPLRRGGRHEAGQLDWRTSLRRARSRVRASESSASVYAWTAPRTEVRAPYAPRTRRAPGHSPCTRRSAEVEHLLRDVA